MIADMVTRIRRRARSRLYLDEWFAHRGLNDEKVAGKIGVHRETVWRWRQEQNRLNPDKISDLAVALDCEPEELWRPPGRPSLDSIVKDAPAELQATAADIVRRLVNR